MENEKDEVFKDNTISVSENDGNEDNSLIVSTNKTKSRESFLGKYPIGEKELYILIHFLGLLGFFVLFTLFRIIVLITHI